MPEHFKILRKVQKRNWPCAFTWSCHHGPRKYERLEDEGQGDVEPDDEPADDLGNRLKLLKEVSFTYFYIILRQLKKFDKDIVY